MADKEIEEIEEPTMEDLEEDLDESEAPQEEEEEEVETESLEAGWLKKRLLMTVMDGRIIYVRRCCRKKKC